MVECKFAPYEGDEKYMFISYAHKDSDAVYGIMNGFMDRGYRQWYDEGITPGTDWPENIATHLQKCEVCVAFVSKNYIDSQNCKREITFALSKNKPLLVIFLEECEMPAGLEMQLSAQQCVFYHKYNEEELFYQKACAGSLLDSCLMEGYVKQAGAVDSSDVATEYVNTASDVLNNKPEDMKAIGDYYDNEAPKAEKKSRSKKPFIFAGLGLVALLLVVGIIVGAVNVIPKLGQVKITDDLTVDSKERSLFLFHENITKDSVNSIKKLKNLEEIKFNECVFEEGVAKELSSNCVRYLTIDNCINVDDYKFIENFPELTELQIDNSGVTDVNIDLTANIDLDNIRINNEPAFSDLNLLPTDNIVSLNIENTGVSDISRLAEMSKLTSVNISDTQVTNITPLVSLEGLMTLDADNLSLEPPTEKFVSNVLYNISMNNCGLNDISFIDNLIYLQQVEFAHNNIKDISPLGNSATKLTYLDFSYNPLDANQVNNISKYSNIYRLNLSGVAMKDVSVIKNMSEIHTLILNGCGIEDISDLAGCKELCVIWLDSNNISDVSVFEKVATADSSFDLVISNNNITDISKLPTRFYNVLYMHGNNLSNTSVPDSVLGASKISVSYFDGILNSRFVQNVGYSGITLVDVPAPAVAEVTILLGDGNEIYSSAEMEEMLKEEVAKIY